MTEHKDEKFIAVNMRLNEEIYSAFRSYCERKGFILSRKVDIILKEFLQNEGEMLPDA